MPSKDAGRVCERCGVHKFIVDFSKKVKYKKDPSEDRGHVCFACAAEDEKKELKERVSRSRQMKQYEKDVEKEVKAEKRKAVKKRLQTKGTSPLTLVKAAVKSKLLVHPKVLEQARERAVGVHSKKLLNAELKKLLKEREKFLASVDNDPKKLPDHLRIDPERLYFLEEKAGKATRADIERASKFRAQKADIQVGEKGLKLTKVTENDLNEDKEAKKEEVYKRELAARTLARRKLIQFIKRMKPNYLAGWVHHDICRRLEKFVADVEEGKHPRLMLFVPPRHGKSLIASDMFPSWVLGQHPDWEFIAASYNVSLPLEFSRNIRDRMKDEAYQQLFPKVNLRQDSQSAERWVTRQGGGYIAAGVGSGITGKGAHILTIDDPIKDAEEADSETIREKAWSWWSSTASTRLAPNSGVLVIQTRWHDADLSGKLIDQMKELRKENAPEDEIDNWEIIEYPALATENEWLVSDGSVVRQAERPDPDAYLLRKKGEALHPDRYDKKFLMRKKRTMQPRHWSALMQQNPMPDEGEYFKKEMFRYSGNLPPLHHMRIFAAFDLAIGEKQQNDYTVGVVGGLDFNDQLYVFDMLRFKGDSFKIVDAILGVYEKYKPEIIGIEKGQLELAIKPILKKRMKERRLYPTLAEGDKALVPITDKLTRARPLQGRMQQGMVYFLNTQPWLETLEHEFLRFPGGVHDDIVDAMAWLMRLVMNEEPPAKPGEKESKKSWRDKLSRYVNEGRGVGHMGA